MPIVRHPFRASFLTLLSFSLVAGSAVGCQGGGAEGAPESAGTSTATSSDTPSQETEASLAVGCSGPSENCPCTVEGLTAQCQGPQIRVGNYTSCAPGVRVCMAGSWSACLAKTLYQNVDSVTQDYASPCAAGTRVRWGALTIQGATPAGSYVAAGVQTADTVAALNTTAADLVGVFSGDETTPWKGVDVGAALATDGAGSGSMLRVTLTLVRAPAGSSPSVMSWQQASTCVPE